MKLQIIPVALALVTAACSTVPATQAHIGGADVGYSVVGAGQPTIIFESGLGDGRNAWRELIPGLADDATLFLYDRPGYGDRPFADTSFDSDRDGRRTGAEVAEHLHSVLAQAGMRPPYVLVGHSIGGLYSLSFAKLYPDEVSGIVLLDSRPPEFTESCRAANVGTCELPLALKLLLPPHMRAEYEGAAETTAGVSDPGFLGSIPTTVVVSTLPGTGMSPAFHDLWRQEQRAFADQIANSHYVELPGARHYVQQDRPDLVNAEIVRLLGGLPPIAGSDRE